MVESNRVGSAGRSSVLSPETRAAVSAVLADAARVAGFQPRDGYGWGRDFWRGTLIHRHGFEAGLHADPPVPPRNAPGEPATDAPGRRPAEPSPCVWADAFVLHPELTDDEWRVAGPVIRDLKRRGLCEGHYRDEAASPPCYLMVQTSHRGPLAVVPITTFLTAFLLELHRIRASIPHAVLWVPGPENFVEYR